MRRLSFPMILMAALLVGGCGGDGHPSCDPADPYSCGSGARCVADGSGGICEDLTACDPVDPASCPSGFVCRPEAGGGAFCQPAPTAGRIPSCIDSAGLDVFAVEANGALSVTWNVNGSIDFAGGFAIGYGLASGDHDDGGLSVGPDVREVILRPLTNDTTYFVVVQALDAGGAVTFTSCEVAAVPHVLAFLGDAGVNDVIAGTQQRPDLASNLEGSRLYLAWESEGAIVFAQSEDFGDTWQEVTFVAPSAAQADPSVAVRDAIFDDAGNLVVPETAVVAWEDGGTIQVVRYDPDARQFEAPLPISPGLNPDLDIGPDGVHLVFEDAGAIYHAASLDHGATFLEPLAISGDTTESKAPSVAVNDFTGDVYVAWDAHLSSGDSNVYFAASFDDGATFQPVERIDDDAMGFNQLNVSIAVDLRSQELYATWEDRRGGANVYFALSEDYGLTWSLNADVGAGLGGDQFNPQAVVDVAANVYVAFQDTTNGQRIVFTRFNLDGSFDPPLAPSTAAGASGVVANFPTVATDRYGAVYVAWEENRFGPDIDIFFARAE